jgi:hypothetical protein
MAIGVVSGASGLMTSGDYALDGKMGTRLKLK